MIIPVSRSTCLGTYFIPANSSQVLFLDKVEQCNLIRLQSVAHGLATRNLVGPDAKGPREFDRRRQGPHLLES